MKFSTKLLLLLVIGLCVVDIFLCVAGPYRPKDERRKPLSPLKDKYKQQKIAAKLKAGYPKTYAGNAEGKAGETHQNVEGRPLKMMSNPPLKIRNGGKGKMTGQTQSKPWPSGNSRPSVKTGRGGQRQHKPWLSEESRPPMKTSRGGQGQSQKWQGGDFRSPIKQAPSGKRPSLTPEDYAKYNFLPVAEHKPKSRGYPSHRRHGHSYIGQASKESGPGYAGQVYPAMGSKLDGKGYPPQRPDQGGKGGLPKDPGYPRKDYHRGQHGVGSSHKR